MYELPSLPSSPVITYDCMLTCCHSSVESIYQQTWEDSRMTNIAAVPLDSYSQVIV